MFVIRKIRFSLLLFLFSFISISMYSQRLDHVLGDIIIEVGRDGDISALGREIRDNYSLRSAPVFKQIAREPMNLWLMHIDPNLDNEIQLLEKIQMSRYVLQAQKNRLGKLRNIPNDPKFNQQWQYINTGQTGGTAGADIDIDLAWDHTTGGVTVDGDTIVVCIIDDGLMNHPDLEGNIWTNRDEIPGNGIDDDGNGYIDDIHGWNTYSGNGNIFTGGGHGTNVTGIVGAKGNNNLGVAGVNWDVKLMIVLGGAQNGEASVLEAYSYSYAMRKKYNETNGDQGAFVVATNASWGIDFGQPEDAPIWCSFYDMLGEQGILNFGATANANINVDEQGDLPTGCTSPYLISVTNMNDNDFKVSSAGYGQRSIDIGAFGSQTYTISGASGYGPFGGTSGATPHVTGTAALLYAADCPQFMSLVKSNPAQAALAVRDFILFGVDQNSTLQGITTTGGRLNVNNAMQNILDFCGNCSAAVGFEVYDITTDQAHIRWANGDQVGTVTLRYRPIGEVNWIEMSDIASGTTLTGLTGCTEYEYQIKTDCPQKPGTYSYAKVFKTDGCCDMPDFVLMDNDTVYSFVWQNVTAADNYIIEYRNIGDTEWQVVDAGLNTEYIFSDLAECEFLEVRFKTHCENMESPYTNPVVISGECGACTREYCAFGPKITTDEWIEKVEIADIFENISGKSDMGYSNFLGNFDINLVPGLEYSIKLMPGYSGTAYDEFFAVFLDMNQNGEFEEFERIVDSGSGVTELFESSFTLPSTLPAGTTRMRVEMRFNASPSPCDDGGFQYGEIEDYCVNIQSDIDCPIVYNAVVIDTTETRFIFSFAPDDRIQSYIIEYRKSGDSDFIKIAQSSNELAVIGLEKCTTYEYRSSIMCSDIELPFTNVISVNTKCDVGVEDEPKNDFQIFPNPSSGRVLIALDNDAQIQKITVFDLSGKGILETKSVNQSRISLDCSELNAGIYLIEISTKDKRYYSKWIKM